MLLFIKRTFYQWVCLWEFPLCGRETNLGSSTYSVFFNSQHMISNIFHPCFKVGLGDWSWSTYFLLFVQLWFEDSDLTEVFIRYCCHTSYLSGPFFTFFVMHFSGKRKVTKNIIDDRFPNWQGVIWPVNGGQFGPWPQDSASQTVLIWSRTLENL